MVKKDTGKPVSQAEEVEIGSSEDLRIFSERLQTWFADNPRVQVEPLQLYYRELIRFNRAINLVAVTSLRSASSLHFADSILASDLISSVPVQGSEIYDFGSGNGFPGLVFSMMHPDRRVVLVERDRRKAEFLKHVAGVLGLKSCSVLNAGVEDLAQGSIFAAMARGFAPLHKALLMTRRQFAPGGVFFHLKSDSWANELAGVQSQVFAAWIPRLLGQYRLPESSVELAVVVTERTESLES